MKPYIFWSSGQSPLGIFWINGQKKLIAAKNSNYALQMIISY